MKREKTGQACLHLNLEDLTDGSDSCLDCGERCAYCALCHAEVSLTIMPEGDICNKHLPQWPA